MRVAGCWVRVTILLATLASPPTAICGETLYNGIVLPDDWPPRPDALTRGPTDVPWLQHRPEIVPIDLGRQLFVDDFLIEETTLKRAFHQATFHTASPVLRPDRPWEKGEAGDKPAAFVFSDGVWYDPVEHLFKMWYFGNYQKKYTCYATSKDGIYWEKPSLDVVPGTNIVLKAERDSSTVWCDWLARSPAELYTMSLACRTDRDWKLQIYHSQDGVHWVKPKLESPKVEGDRSTIFFNPFRNKWVYSLRGWHDATGRDRQYLEGVSLEEAMTRFDHDRRLWTNADALDPHNLNPRLSKIAPQLYNLDAVAYESVMLGLFSIWQGDPAGDLKEPREKRNELLLGFSRDGFHWHRPDRRLFVGVNESPGAWNWGNVQSAGGGCLVVGDWLYFYVSGREEDRKKGACSTGLALLRRDGFASMDADDDEGTLTTRPLTFMGKHLFVNMDAAGGELRVEVLDRDGQVLPTFAKDKCVAVTADSTIQAVRWGDLADLSTLSGKPIRFRFHLRKGKLYSFWVSPDDSGASRGYVAAGGPGYPGPADTVGAKALAAAGAAVMPPDCPARSEVDCPAWAREKVPIWVQPYLGRFGLPAPFPRQKYALGNCTAGIDMWQANHFVGYGDATSKYLYDSYSSTAVAYRQRTFPLLEKIVTKYTAGLSANREKALALLTRGMPELMAHPSIPPYSPDVRPDRAMTEEDLVKSGMGWCNEQARVFVRLCQVTGIPARLIFLFYSDDDGHVVAEFYADGRWCMADSSWGCVFPDADGTLMSAARCHADAQSKRRVQEAYLALAREMASASDDHLVGRRYADITDVTARAKKIAEHASDLKNNLRSGSAVGKLGEKLWAFGVMNMPLP